MYNRTKIKVFVLKFATLDPHLSIFELNAANFKKQFTFISQIFTPQSTCTPKTGYFHDETKIFQTNL